jgi:hypothetical protein
MFQERKPSLFSVLSHFLNQNTAPPKGIFPSVLIHEQRAVDDKKIKRMHAESLDSSGFKYGEYKWRILLLK